MPRLIEGEKISDFKFDTFEKDGVDFYNFLKEGQDKTLVVFLRYFGCTLCQLQMVDFKENIKKLEDLNVKLLVALQSERDTLKEDKGAKDLPFEILLDPEQKLYKEFDIKAAKSKLTLVDTRIAGKLLEAKKLGLEHGKYEGNELQLTAYFILDNEGNIIKAHYAKNICDMPNANEFVEIIEGLSK